jgi:hypothetical protein
LKRKPFPPQTDAKVRALYFDAAGNRISEPTYNKAERTNPEPYEVSILEIGRRVAAVTAWMKSTEAVTGA